MARDNPEWVGKDDNTKVPERIKDRVREAAGDCCANCKLRVAFGGQIDHVIALKNWTGASGLPHGNRQSNLQLLCRSCHTAKTGGDVAEKARAYKKRKAYSCLAKQRKKSPWCKKYNRETGRFETVRRST